MPDPTTAQVTRNQHYIPQFYLKKFCGSDRKVQVLSCEQNKLFTPRHPRSICSEEFYYGATTGVPDPVSQEVEGLFSALESSLAEKLSPIEEKILNGSQIDEGEKWVLAFLMSMIWIRGPIMREQNRRMIEDLAQQMMRMTFRMPEDYIKGFFDQFDRSRGETTSPEMREKIKAMSQTKDYKVNVNNVFHIAMFADIHNYANLFAAQDWFVFISKAKLGFITSDNPVAEIFPEREGFHGPTFFEREHHFALSPEIMIQCKHPNKKNSKGLRRKTYYEGDGRKILSLNTIIGIYGLKFLYAQEKESLEGVLGVVQFARRQKFQSIFRNPSTGRVL